MNGKRQQSKRRKARRTFPALRLVWSMPMAFVWSLQIRGQPGAYRE
jgi:hypothetical protein